MQVNNQIVSPKLNGDIRYIELDAKTGDVLSSYHEHNVVVDTHMDIIIARLYEDNPEYKVTKARIGTDVGTGTNVDPELPTTLTTAEDQEVIYETTENVSVDYGSPRSITYNIFLNGETIMNLFPQEESIGFNSLSLTTQNDIVFSYRRFPERSITEATNINILWTLYYA